MEILKASNPRFIRCIKPNAFKRPRIFESIDVNRQLQYSGVLATVMIRRAGYPLRQEFYQFVQRYSIILKTNMSMNNKKEINL